MRSFKWLFAVVIFLGIILAAAPFAGRWYLTSWLQDKGFAAGIKSLRVNYALGRVTLNAVKLHRAGVQHADLFQLQLDFDLPKLLQGQWVLEDVKVENLQLTLERTDEHWQVAGLALSEWMAGKREWQLQIRRLHAVNTDLCTQDQQQCLRMESLRLADTTLRRLADEWVFSHRSPLVVSKAFLQDRSNAASVFYLESLSVQEGHYSPEAMSLTSLALSNFQLIENQQMPGGQTQTPYQAQIGELTIALLAFSFGDQPGIKVSKLKVDSFRQAIARFKNAEYRWPERIRRWFPEFFALWEGASLDGDNVTPIAVDDVELLGGRLNWMDNTVSPPAVENLSRIKLSLSDLNSEAKQKANINLEGRIGEIGALKLEGTSQLFVEDPVTHLSGYLHGLDMSHIGGYSDAVFNQRITAGVFDVSFEAGMAAGQVAGHSYWRITGLDAEGGSMESAFRKLADHNNSVELKLPIGIAIDERPGPVASIGRALANTLKNKASGVKSSSTLKERPAALQKLAPVFFATRASEPAELDMARVPAIAKTAKDRPEASLVVCPVATGGEWAELYNDGRMPAEGTEPSADQRSLLLELTAERGARLKRLLVREGVKPSRIIVCGPSVDMSKSGPSLATIAL